MDKKDKFRELFDLFHTGISIGEKIDFLNKIKIVYGADSTIKQVLDELWRQKLEINKTIENII